MPIVKCPTCQQSEQDHRLRKRLCPEIECGCRNCLWCGHSFKLHPIAIELDHADALELNKQEVSNVTL